jgi:hypothetical protein
MNPIVRSNVLAYRPGDKRGLARLARQTATIKTAIPPVGALEDSKFDRDNTIHFSGWALLKYLPSDPVTVELIDNGRVLSKAGTTVLRPDVNRAQDPGKRMHGYSLSIPWKGGSHHFCLRALSARHPGASAQLGCVTWRD